MPRQSTRLRRGNQPDRFKTQPLVLGGTLEQKTLSIRDRFPDEGPAIDRLIAEDADFLAMCEDHDACVHALRHWSRATVPEADTRIDEYRRLIQELEAEIVEVLGARILPSVNGTSM